jgi:NAD(P)H-nitrite reductase large subunit
MKNGWRILVGGNGGSKPRLAVELMKDLPENEALDLIDKIIKFYRENGKKNQRIGGLIEEIGLDEFKNKLGIA